jgi:hypothetical protein
MEAWKHFRAVLLLPVTVTVVMPATILCLTGVDSLGFWQSYPTTRFVILGLGIIFTCLGFVLMAATIRLFVTVGKGTLAPGTRRGGS